MNILLTSAGRRTYLIDYFKDAMKGIGKVYASNSEYTYSLSHADDYIITPLIYDNDYIDFLIEYCKQKQINALISLFDIDLFVLADNKDRFEKNNIKLIISNKKAISICNDKYATYCFLKDNDIPCPKTYLTIEDTLNAINENIISYPIIIKPRWGMGSIGISIAENQEELKVLSNKVFNQIFKTYLKYESIQNPERCVLYQEYINGQEYGLDVFNNFNSEFVSLVAKKKVSMRAGETDIAEIVSNEPFLDIAKKISFKLNHIGNLDVDVFVSQDNKIYVLEFNCRFGGQYPFSHLAGVNFPKQIVQWILGKSNDQTLLSAKTGVIACKDLVPVILK